MYSSNSCRTVSSRLVPREAATAVNDSIARLEIRTLVCCLSLTKPVSANDRDQCDPVAGRANTHRHHTLGVPRTTWKNRQPVSAGHLLERWRVDVGGVEQSRVVHARWQVVVRIAVEEGPTRACRLGSERDAQWSTAVLAVSLGELREALGHNRLGVRALEQIATSLAGEGLGYFPEWVLTDQNQAPRYGDVVRVFRKGTGLGEVVTAVLEPTDRGDERLKEIADGDAVEILSMIRLLLAE